MSSVTNDTQVGDDDESNSNMPEDQMPVDENSTLRDYLYKMTRDGRWQRRWFETNGIFLTYYKSRRREKLLAALSLLQVGEIKQITPPNDAELNNREGWFTIQLNSRLYTLRARNNEEAERWVQGLNLIKETNPDTGTTVSPMKDMAYNPSASKDSSTGNAEWNKKGSSWSCC